MNIFTIDFRSKWCHHRLQTSRRRVFACSDFRVIPTNDNTLFVVPLPQHNPHLTRNCAQLIPVLPDPPLSCHHFSLCSKRSPQLACMPLGPLRRPVWPKPLGAVRSGPSGASAAPSGGRDLGSLHRGTPTSPAFLSPLGLKSGLSGGQAFGLRYCGQTLVQEVQTLV